MCRGEEPDVYRGITRGNQRNWYIGKREFLEPGYVLGPSVTLPEPSSGPLIIRSKVDTRAR